jgi:broad specificity phosphatase PhoE
MATRPRLSARQRQRRLRRRAISLFVYGLIVFGLAWYFDSQTTTTIIFVRHADTNAAAMDGGDQPLNERGMARSELLAEFLSDIDVLAGVDAIYASEFKRTQQTAAPLAERLGLEVQLANHDDVVGFMRDVQSDHKGRIVLVVTHSNVLAQLVAELHGHQSIPEIAPDEYDNVYIVTIPLYGKVKTLGLPYALGWTGPDSYQSR